MKVDLNRFNNRFDMSEDQAAKLMLSKNKKIGKCLINLAERLDLSQQNTSESAATGLVLTGTGSHSKLAHDGSRSMDAKILEVLSELKDFLYSSLALLRL